MIFLSCTIASKTQRNEIINGLFEGREFYACGSKITWARYIYYEFNVFQSNLEPLQPVAEKAIFLGVRGDQRSNGIMK